MILHIISIDFDIGNCTNRKEIFYWIKKYKLRGSIEIWKFENFEILVNSKPKIESSSGLAIFVR